MRTPLFSPSTLFLLMVTSLSVFCCLLLGRADETFRTLSASYNYRSAVIENLDWYILSVHFCYEWCNNNLQPWIAPMSTMTLSTRQSWTRGKSPYKVTEGPSNCGVRHFVLGFLIFRVEYVSE